MEIVINSVVDPFNKLQFGIEEIVPLCEECDLEKLDKIDIGYFLENQKIIPVKKEIYYKEKEPEQEGEFYLMWKYKFEFIFTNENQDKESINFEFIQHGFFPFYLNFNSDIHFYPFNPSTFVQQKDYKYPHELEEGFKKIKMRKRELVCHYSKMETAFLKIFPSKSLRFNKIKNTNDPWEYKKNLKVSSVKIENIFETFQKSSIIQKLVKRVKSISFTRDFKHKRCFDNILMWAHYGENHKGICWVFDEYKLKELFERNFNESQRLKLKIVDYIEFAKEIIIDSDDIPQDLLRTYEKALFYTKNIAWEYEKEYRLMLFPDEEENTFLNKIDTALVAIIIGTEFQEEYKKDLECLKNEFFPNSKIFQMAWATAGYFKIQDLESTNVDLRCSNVLKDFVVEI